MAHQIEDGNQVASTTSTVAAPGAELQALVTSSNSCADNYQISRDEHIDKTMFGLLIS